MPRASGHRWAAGRDDELTGSVVRKPAGTTRRPRRADPGRWHQRRSSLRRRCPSRRARVAGVVAGGLQGTGCPWVGVPGPDNGSSNCAGGAADGSGGNSNDGRRCRRQSTSPEEDSSARRYARLLVSEIKLYNEAAVRAGRQKRDLLTRLAPEIERARRLYEERVSPAIGARAAYFQQELVHTLADGDSALLGNAR